MRTRTEQSIAITALLALCAFLYFGAAGCTTMQGKEFDTCKAVSIAKSSDAVADGVSGMVCALLKGEKRAQCLKHRATASTAAKAALGLVESIVKACGI
jgi:predicted small secreted protein